MKAWMILLLVFGLPLLSACPSSVKIKLSVFDETGKPIEGVKVKGAFNDLSRNTSFLESMKGVTDKNGVATISGKSYFMIPIWAEKENFYQFRGEAEGRSSGTKEVEVVLREKRNPIAMYAKKVVGPVPGYNRKLELQQHEYGYDFVVGDYVAPLGKGKVKDLSFLLISNRKSDNDFELTRQVSFSNDQDGLIPYYFKYRGAGFRDQYLAPEFGYQQEWLQTAGRKPDLGATGNLDRYRNYYIRVRSVINQAGEIVSAHYGKLHGDFPHFTYYLNPTPNDRNIEFDPSKNLFKNLDYDERVNKP